jgi:hypothetical protein
MRFATYKHDIELVKSAIASLHVDLKDNQVHEVADLLQYVPTEILKSYIIDADLQEFWEDKRS